jgi:hypothetical protein
VVALKRTQPPDCKPAKTKCPGYSPGFSFVILPSMDKLTVEDVREMLPELDQIHAKLDAIEAAEQARHESLMEQLQACQTELLGYITARS